MVTPVTPPDFIAIARDIAQESCHRIPITERRHAISDAAIFVKKLCKTAKDLTHWQEIAKLILYCALVVEYAADFVVIYPSTIMSERYVHRGGTTLPLSRQSLTVLLSVREEMETIDDIFKSTEPGVGNEVETGCLKTDLINALANVRLSHPAKISILTSLNPTGFKSRQ